MFSFKSNLIKCFDIKIIKHVLKIYVLILFLLELGVVFSISRGGVYDLNDMLFLQGWILILSIMLFILHMVLFFLIRKSK